MANVDDSILQEDSEPIIGTTTARDPWDASLPTLQIDGTKCIWSSSTIATGVGTGPADLTFSGKLVNFMPSDVRF